MKTELKLKPVLFRYLSITKYLEDLYAFKKAESAGFSYDSWASDLGFKSRSFIKMIIAGDRNITLQFIEVFSQSMSYTSEEKNYFSLIANYNQCENEDEKKYYQDRMFEIQGQEKDLNEITEYTEFLSSKNLPQLLVLLSFTDLDKTTQGLATFLSCPVENVINDLNALQKMHLVSNENGIWIATKKSFKVPKNSASQALMNYHNNSLLEAIAAQKLPAAERNFRSVLLALAEKDYVSLLLDIEALVCKTVAKYDSDTISDKRLYKMNINLIPTLPSQATAGPEYKLENATRLLEI